MDDMAKDHGPTIKDDEKYEALRDDGMSKEKAARIANTGGKKAEKRGGKSPPYEEWTKEALYERAQEIGIDGRSDMDKEQLIDALRNH
ncbi:MAG: Rho termination factor N-terminal domain-containing protein [Sandaracinaceae bacterium]